MSEQRNRVNSAAGESLKQTFKCSSCGARMEYKPGSSAQSCPYCGHENPIPTSEKDIRELDFEAHLEQCRRGEAMEEQLTVACSECGASMTTGLPSRETEAFASNLSSRCRRCRHHRTAPRSRRQRSEAGWKDSKSLKRSRPGHLSSGQGFRSTSPPPGSGWIGWLVSPNPHKGPSVYLL